MIDRRGAFITIGGIDGVGKTTSVEETTRLFCEKGVSVVNYDLYEKECSNPFSPAKSRVLTETGPYAQFAYYLGSTLHHSSRIEGLVREGRTVIKSRYLDDVVAHHLHLGVKDAEAITRLFPFFQPDLRIVLTLSEDERRRRILERGELDKKDEEVRRVGSRLDFFERYLLKVASQYSPERALLLDSGCLNPKEIALSIFNKLDKIIN